MNKRFSFNMINREGYALLGQIEQYLKTISIDGQLVELLKIRSSQINGCAFCINMHTRDARRLGETEQRIYALNAWRETPFFTPAERAALAFTEALTLVAEKRMPDDVYDELRQHFSEKQISEIILVLTTINTWNRLAIATGMQPDASNSF